jgi:Undecaprenyl-phosphate glucose phosphotransferase
VAGRGYSKYQKLISITIDLFLLFIVFHIAYYIRQDTFFTFTNNDYVLILLVYLFSWWIIINNTELIVIKRGITLDKVFFSLLRNTFIHIVIVYLTMIILRLYSISRLLLFFAFLLEIGILSVWRIIFYKFITQYRKSGFNYRNIIIIGDEKNSRNLAITFNEKSNFGYKIKGILSTKNFNCNTDVYDIKDFKNIIDRYKPDEVFCSLTPEIEDIIPEIIQYCEQHVIRIKLFPNFQRFIKKKVKIDFLQDIPVLLLRTEPLESMAARAMKRFFDIVFSSLVIITIMSWLTPLMALLIKIESRGPVFFAQKRTGKNNHIFYMLKFRSMTVNKDSDKIQAKKGDSRITRVGKFMRKTSIDELPQFFNVLKGDMSVVGPRPHMLQHTKEYTEIINEYMVRHFVKPGITGWAQINGFRGPTPTPDLMHKRVEHDVWYIENWSFILDIIIIVRTVVNVFKGEENAV